MHVYILLNLHPLLYCVSLGALHYGVTDFWYIHGHMYSWQLRLSIFIYVDILVLVSVFVVVAIISEWWLMPTTVGTSLWLYI